MNSLLLNRDFQLPTDSWFQVVPIGEFHHPADGGAGIVQVIDQAALKAMLEDFRNAARKPNYPGLLVDFDHFSSDTSKPSEAAGWVTDLANRDGGLWAKIRWSDVGEAAVKGGRYRLVSPVFSRRGADDLGNGRLRPRTLLSVALTNDPNLKGMVPLSNRSDSNPAPRKTERMKSVALKLGLSEEASEQAVLSKVTELQDRTAGLTKSEGEWKNRAEKAEGDLANQRKASVETDLAPYKDRLPEGTEAFWRESLLTNRDVALKNLAAAFPARGAAQSGASGNQVLNRNQASNPGSASARQEDQPAHHRFTAEVKRYQLANRCTFQEAWEATQIADPALFEAANKRD